MACIAEVTEKLSKLSEAGPLQGIPAANVGLLIAGE
jgi:hypothetical protein